jgi:hypothetical protein
MCASVDIPAGVKQVASARKQLTESGLPLLSSSEKWQQDTIHLSPAKRVQYDRPPPPRHRTTHLLQGTPAVYLDSASPSHAHSSLLCAVDCPTGLADIAARASSVPTTGVDCPLSFGQELRLLGPLESLESGGVPFWAAWHEQRVMILDPVKSVVLGGVFFSLR